MKHLRSTAVLVVVLAAACSAADTTADTTSTPRADPVPTPTVTVMPATTEPPARTAPTVTDEAAAPAVTTLDDLTGVTLDAAKAALRAHGVRLDATDIRSNRMIIVEANWEIVSQDPLAGTELEAGTTVHVMVDKTSDLRRDGAAAAAASQHSDPVAATNAALEALWENANMALRLRTCGEVAWSGPHKAAETLASGEQLSLDTDAAANWLQAAC